MSNEPSRTCTSLRVYQWSRSAAPSGVRGFTAITVIATDADSARRAIREVTDERSVLQLIDSTQPTEDLADSTFVHVWFREQVSP